MENTNNYNGMKFNNLTIISEYNGKVGAHSGRCVHCVCDCGREVDKYLFFVLNGHDRTCGKCGRVQIGDKYGKLTVISKLESSHGRSKWLCECECGTRTGVFGNNLRRGHTTSCGCEKYTGLVKELGLTKTSETEHHNYSLNKMWYGMFSRCYADNSHYASYKEKGIQVCDEWKDFDVFYEWAYSNGYYDQPADTKTVDKLCIDRIDPNKDYCPENCQFITVKENCGKDKYKTT